MLLWSYRTRSLARFGGVTRGLVLPEDWWNTLAKVLTIFRVSAVIFLNAAGTREILHQVSQQVYGIYTQVRGSF
jgi:hypothetical protein